MLKCFPLFFAIRNTFQLLLCHSHYPVKTFNDYCSKVWGGGLHTKGKTMSVLSRYKGVYVIVDSKNYSSSVTKIYIHVFQSFEFANFQGLIFHPIEI